MLSVRVFVTDFASPLVGRLAHELGAADYFSVFGRLCQFYVNVAHHHPNGVLDGLAAPAVARLAHWTGASDVFLEAMLRAGALCRPSVDPHHHARCTARGPNRQGEPKRRHPPAELAVHEWDKRAGLLFRAYVSDSRPARRSFFLRPPPRRARAGYETAPRGMDPVPRLDAPGAPQGVEPESAAPRGGSGFTPRGVGAAGSPEGVSGPDGEGRPAGRLSGVRKGAPRGGYEQPRLADTNAPQGAKRPPKPHRRPRGEETKSPPPSGSAGARPAPAPPRGGGRPARGSQGRTTAAAGGRKGTPHLEVPAKRSEREEQFRAYLHGHPKALATFGRNYLADRFRASRACPWTGGACDHEPGHEVVEGES